MFRGARTSCVSLMYCQKEGGCHGQPVLLAPVWLHLLSEGLHGVSHILTSRGVCSSS